MATYSVTIPITGYIINEVSADSEEEAIDKAMDESYTSEDIEMWQPMRRIVQGNILYADHNEASAEFMYDEDDDG